MTVFHKSGKCTQRAAPYNSGMTKVPLPLNLCIHRKNHALLSRHYLPSYSPDLNPDEYLNRDLKSNLNNRPLGRAKGKTEERAKDHMENLSHDSEHVARLFQAESVRYAS